MLSPSLLSMIFHSLWRDNPEAKIELNPSSDESIASALNRLKAGFRAERWPEVPVSAAVADPGPADGWFGKTIRISRPPQRREQSPSSAKGGEYFFWGRVPVDSLIGYYETRPSFPAETEFLDLAGSLSRNALGSDVTAPGSLKLRIESLLSQTALSPSAAAVRLAIVDQGKTTDVAVPTCSPHLGLVGPGNLDLHAEQVLLTLLERLQQNGILGQSHVSCALAAPPTSPIGLPSFDGYTAVELQHAVENLDLGLGHGPGPIVTNLSMGNHVGPHNGLSPLECHASRLASPPDRLLFAAAGNDGGRGRSGRIELVPDTEGTFHVAVGSACSEILIEFWWPLAGMCPLLIEVTGETSDGRPMGFGVLRLDSLLPDRFKTVYPHRNLVCLSLFTDLCCGGMGCIAFAASTHKSQGFMPACKLTFTLLSQCPTAVNAWIVECNNDANFVDGGERGNLCSPATAKGVFCVAGVKQSRQHWPRSSRGPAYDYSFRCGCGDPSCPIPARRLTEVLSEWNGYNDDAKRPHLAHQVIFEDFATEFGTSFASPRAAADAAAVLVNDPSLLNRRLSARDLAIEILRSKGLPVQDWDSRMGFGRI